MWDTNLNLTLLPEMGLLEIWNLMGFLTLGATKTDDMASELAKSATNTLKKKNQLQTSSQPP